MVAVERGSDVNLIESAEFLALSCEQRRATAKEKSVCFNCLRPRHLTKQCEIHCESKFNCRIWHGRHHTLLHTTLADANFASVSPIDILLGSNYVWTTLTGKKCTTT